MRKPQHLSPRSATGASLLEVLIAVLVLAVGLLGVAALQAGALRNNQSSYERSEAVIQTYAMFDILRANRDAALAGSYNLTKWSCTKPAAGTRVQNERRAWVETLQSNLGASACATITCAANNCVVGVRWDDSRGTGDHTAAQTHFIETTTRL